MRILFKLNPYLQQRQYEKPRWIFPIQLAMYATYLRNEGNIVIWDKQDDGSFDKIITLENQIDVPFLELPHADRILTDAFNPKWQNNGNFKYRPGTYIQSANSCWFKKCTFCVEAKKHLTHHYPRVIDTKNSATIQWEKEKPKGYLVRPVNDVIAEIEECRRLGYRDIFDDSGTFPIGRWLDDFCKRLEKIPICFSCNFRAIDYDYRRLRKAGFRMLLFGLESANETTLKKIKKGITVEDAKKNIIKAARAGLEVHIAVMFGYPWETDEDAQRTLKLVHYLLRKGYAKTAQASFYTVGGLQYNLGHKRFVNKIYNAAFYPSFWFNKIKDIKNIDDIKYIWRGIKAALKR